jgi:hypothetical protein
MEAGEHLDELRDHEHVHDDHRRRHRDDHEGRIAQRGLDPLAHVAVELEVVEQAQEHFFQAAGHLAHAHHRQVEGENTSGWRRIAADSSRPESSDSRKSLMTAERFVDRRFLQAGQAAHDRHAGLEQRVQLAAEQLHVHRRDLLLGQRAHQPSPPLVTRPFCAWSAISIGVTPVPNSWSATAPLSAPSSTPCISSPRALRPCKRRTAR